MPVGPNGEKRPGGTGACAIMVVKISTGETEGKTVTVDADKRRAGLARSSKLSKERRSEIAKPGAKARWG